MSQLISGRKPDRRWHGALASKQRRSAYAQSALRQLGERGELGAAPSCLFISSTQLKSVIKGLYGSCILTRPAPRWLMWVLLICPGPVYHLSRDNVTLYDLVSSCVSSLSAAGAVVLPLSRDARFFSPLSPLLSPVVPEAAIYV